VLGSRGQALQVISTGVITPAHLSFGQAIQTFYSNFNNKAGFFMQLSPVTRFSAGYLVAELNDEQVNGNT